MRLHHFVTYLALAAGAGVAAAGTASAGTDPIYDAWPYGGAAGPYYAPLYMPGYYEAGSGTSSGDLVYTHTSGGTDEWYSAHTTTFDIPNLYDSSHEVVTKLLDGSASYPNVGTTYDQSELFPIYSPAFGTMNLVTNDTISDPKLGFGNQLSILGLSNTFLSDPAGIKDVVSSFGHQFTLFDLPFTAPGADASDDGFAPLLAELTASGS